MRISRNTVQEQVYSLLMERKLDELVSLCQRDRRYWKALRFAAYAEDESLVWPAIEATALLMQHWWLSGSQEPVREYVRTLLWSLNDESGGIGWNAPQIIAETIINIPELAEPYASMMISRTLEEPPLVTSGLWAIGRLGKQIRNVLVFFEDLILEVLKSHEPQTLGLASWAMGEAGFVPSLPYIQRVVNSTEPVRIYINGGFQQKTLGRWAQEAIRKIEEGRNSDALKTGANIR